MTTPNGGFDLSNVDMNGLLAQAQAMQAQLAQAQQQLESTTFDGSAGGGLVKAVVTGTGELTGLTIDPQTVDPDDTDTLADLVIAAVHDASGKAAAAQQAMTPKIPGMGL
ncbi:YbaB/EbfC family nucleoid-associated protein [Cutibacterium granulosum]|jgi:DNA-binding protein, ybaB/ebfC family|uniref:Nucleoid-associated protein H641_04022 n=2 Tax=Cutibacterium granulosum TaxID=33011 RepID=U1GG14_9ACTN|nr:YbaB/EbfC family nucleoid-associated protein [Cutibacterium granulosum]ERS36000.1 YbaB/EbfC family DNA-binding protein [Propionibacterium sp. KPL1844]MDU1863413.1 YbaB/EbfC family nucleoid-associated protein [Propionibacterium sp.]MDU3272972.1 YbaB/EbfC family nucleoid-associated protein [Cutibacterium sp.]ERF57090.1 DNA-binding protein, YbaB/EbfC family [Cutibacterium granulosum DSM 20700]KAG9059351.1 YbaB/EbfC family nucleoid-associated protein [Cutibacterium granulosum DSM 20700]